MKFYNMVGYYTTRIESKQAWDKLEFNIFDTLTEI